MCEEINDSERQFTEQDLNDAFKAGMRWLKFNYTENWNDGYVDDWRDFIGEKRKEAKANDTEEATASSFRVNALVNGKAAEIARKHLFESMDFTGKERASWEPPEWLLKAMDEYARIKCNKQREICAKMYRPGYDEKTITHDILNAPEPPL